MDNMRDIVGRVFKNLGKNQSSSTEKIERVWNGVLKPIELQHTKIIGMRDGKILVNVDAPAWLYQMKLRKKKILESLQEELPDISEIYFQTGKTV
jgi:hypothetical protein